MGVNTLTQSNCLAGSSIAKHLIIDGRLQEFASTKELIRQLPFVIEGNLVNNRDWLFQRTLTSASPSAIFPVDPTLQFYTPTSGTLVKDLNSTEGYDLSTTSNLVQPSLVFIASDGPVSVIFGYAPDPYIWRDPKDISKSLFPEVVFTSKAPNPPPTTEATGIVTVATDGTISSISILTGGAGYTVGSDTVDVTVGGTLLTTGVQTTVGADGVLSSIRVIPPGAGSGYHPAPANVNRYIIVNGYYIARSEATSSKIAPAIVGDLTDWDPGVKKSPTGVNGTWAASEGESTGNIHFPIKVTKASSVSDVKILIYCAKLV